MRCAWRCGSLAWSRPPTLAGDAAHIELSAPGAERWWPRSHGTPALHECVITLHDAAGIVLDTWTRQVGFRDIAIVSELDAIGRSFAIHVNGERVWVRGADWIPDHTYQTEVTQGRLQERIDQAVAANMDLLRIWGGGTFESDAFYDACDRAGILVWQDLPFACASYPEDPETAANVAAEVRDAVARLGSPSQPGRLERLQRVHLGLVRLGLAGAARGSPVGPRLLPRAGASAARRARPRPAVPTQQPLVGHARHPPQR